jgi:hypothetical protein
MPILRSIALFCVAGCIAFPALSDSKISQLSQSDKWRALLHYQVQGLNNVEYSEVDDDRFFLSDAGKYDALAELKATIATFQQPQEGDSAAICRFPARLNWLQKVLPEQNFTNITCPAFDDWYSKVQGDELFLIFPSSYINSPSSMFGHTLFRLDGKQGHQLLSSAINFAAFTDANDDELTFTAKGLSGGYPGYVSLVPYYEKVNEYNHIESRDIWEYKLELTNEQVQEFTRHIWELNEIRFDYFFIDENCSYRLLTLLDVVDPSWKLAAPFTYRTVPTDTIRVLEKKGLIGDVKFRPSKTTIIEHQRLQLDADLRIIGRQLADDPYAMARDEQFLNLNDQQKVQVLDIAYGYTRYLNLKKNDTDPTLPKRSLKLLSMRSKVDFKGDAYKPLIQPAVRDEHGHKTLRSTIGATEDFLEIGFRINYHDWLDNLPGYRKGAQIEMGDIRFRADESHLQLQHFDVISIRSLGPRNRFSQPISWQVNGGYERWLSDDEGQWQVKLGGGYGYEVGPGTAYAFLQTQLANSDRYDDNWRLGAGGELGYLIQKNQFSAWLSAEHLASVVQEGESTEYQVGVGVPISRNQQVRLQWQKQKWRQLEEEQVRLTYAIYH